MRLQLLLVPLILILFAPALFSQIPSRGAINGTVNLRDGRPAAFIQVRLIGNTTGFDESATTDERGRFAFTSLASGKIYNLTIELRGYYTYSHSIDLSVSRAYESITLQPDLSDKTAEVPPEGAAAAVDARIAQIPPEAKKEFEGGQTSMQASDFPSAIAHFQKATVEYPRYAEAFQLMGVSYLQSNNIAAAVPALEQAIKIEDRLPQAHFYLGVCRNVQRQFTGAEQSLLKSLELAPDSAEEHFELARTYFATDRYPEAERQARKSLELNLPNRAAAYLFLGFTMLREKNAREAKTDFEEYLKLEPQGEGAPQARQLVQAIDKAGVGK